jgi:hypothetical protein
MSAPSTTTYYPFDAGAPAVFSRDETGNYIFGELTHKLSKIEAFSSLCASRISRESHFGELLLRRSHVHSLVVTNIRLRYHAGQRGMSSLLWILSLLHLTLSGRVDLDV